MKKILQTPQEYKGRSMTLGRVLIFIGIIFIVIFAFFKIVSVIASSTSTGFLKSMYEISVSTVPESFVALGAIILFFGFLLLFFNRQFSILDEIKNEIENNDGVPKEHADWAESTLFIKSLQFLLGVIIILFLSFIVYESYNFLSSNSFIITFNHLLITISIFFLVLVLSVIIILSGKRK